MAIFPEWLLSPYAESSGVLLHRVECAVHLAGAFWQHGRRQCVSRMSTRVTMED